MNSYRDGNRDLNPSMNRYARMDHGTMPFVANIEMAADKNQFYRSAFWTGKYLQMTLMCIPVGGEIGLEMHPDTDQFIRVEQGIGMVIMGAGKEHMNFKRRICKEDGVFVPACAWHNIINTGNTPLKLSSIYAPPHHPRGTIHRTKKDSDEAGY